MMSVYDAPNQQVVRPDGSGPADTGSGGSGAGEAGPPAADTGGDLDAMTKEQLLELATSLGVSPANAGMTKDELKAGIEAHRAGEAGA